jgi:hypothetical protein
MIHAGRAIERVIEAHWGKTFASHRSHIASRLSSNDVFDENFLVSLRDVRAPTFTNRSLDIRLGWSVYDPRQSASFPPHVNPRLVILFLTHTQTDDSDYSMKRWQHITAEEQEAWVYSSLGPKWFDYAYRIHTSRSLVRYMPTRFAVLVNDDGEPLLAPADFDWMLASDNEPAVRVKLRPRTPSDELEHTLRTIGDVTPVTDRVDG